jgi:hypothetical protein
MFLAALMAVARARVGARRYSAPCAARGRRRRSVRECWGLCGGGLVAGPQEAYRSAHQGGPREHPQGDVARPEKTANRVVRGTAEVTIASTKAIDRTAPVFCSSVLAPAATPRLCAGTVPIIAAVFGLLNIPEPTPTISSHRPLSQYGVCTCSVVIAARPAALTSMPSAASPREPCRSAYIPARGEAISMPSARGVSLMPAAMGELPCAPWK